MHSVRAVMLVAVLAFAQLPAGAQSAVVPGEFQGRWGSSQARCMFAHEGGLTVSADEFLFYESRAKVHSAQQVGRQEVEFDMEFSGEGQTWRGLRRFALSSDTRTLTDVTGPAPFARVRCEQNPLPFLDEGPSDPDFLAFRSSLLDAVASRDAAYILSIVSDRIRNSFGGDGGIDEFERVWQLDAQDSRFWTEFGTVLRLGGAFQGEDGFLAPYTTATWPNNLDGFQHVAVIGTNVNVRSEPSLTAPVVSRMSYQTVRMVMGWPPGEWLHVRLADGTGYINVSYVRSPIGYRAFFERTDGRWVMTIFIAGD